MKNFFVINLIMFIKQFFKIFKIKNIKADVFLFYLFLYKIIKILKLPHFYITLFKILTHKITNCLAKFFIYLQSKVRETINKLKYF